MPNNELQELLGARFEGHTQPTNEAVWDAIEAQLDEEQKDRVGIWFWIFNGIAATLLIGMMFQSYGSIETLKSNTFQLTEQTMKETSVPESNSSNEIKQNELKEANELAGSNLNSESSTEDLKGTSGKSANAPTQNSRSIASEMKVVQHSVLTEVSTNFKGGTIVTTHAGPKYEDYSVDQLPTKTLAYSREESTVNSTRPSIRRSQFGNYFKRLPVHLGVEVSYLDRSATNEQTSSGSNFTEVIDQLANRRHFEFSLFSQFDFTHRFSTSIGLGYSQSQIESSNEIISSAFSSMISSIESRLDLITIPVQTKFTLLRKSRFALSGGLTFQGEFGRIIHTEELLDQSWNTTGSTTTSIEESIGTNGDIEINFQQFAFEPHLQFSVNILPRISAFTNVGYKMYLNQSNIDVAPTGRLNYLNADIGLLFRLR